MIKFTAGALMALALAFSGPAMAQSQKKVAASMQCGGGTVEIQCEGATQADGTTDCTQTSIRLKNADGEFTRILKPAEFVEDDSNTAQSMSCSKGSDGKDYVVAVYGGLPYGCSHCEWYYVYDANGRQLTKSQPLTVTAEDLPEGQHVGPNNAESSALIEKLGLKTDDQVSVSCERRDVAADGPACLVK